MKLKLKSLLVALISLLPTLASAQASRGQAEFTLQSMRDTDQITSFEYCRTLGNNGLVMGQNRVKTQRVTTVGSAITVTGVASTNTFTGLSVGDEIWFTALSDEITAGAIVTRRGQVFRRVILTKASDDSITVGPAALNITSGATFQWRKVECGTAATNGWVPVNNLSTLVFHLNISQINTTTGVDYTVECRVLGTSAAAVTVIASATVTTTTSLFLPGLIASPLGIAGPVDECRFGTRITTTDDGVDTGAAAEQVSVYLTGRLATP